MNNCNVLRFTYFIKTTERGSFEVNITHENLNVVSILQCISKLYIFRFNCQKKKRKKKPTALKDNALNKLSEKYWIPSVLVYSAWTDYLISFFWSSKGDGSSASFSLRCLRKLSIFASTSCKTVEAKRYVRMRQHYLYQFEKGQIHNNQKITDKCLFPLKGLSGRHKLFFTSYVL